MSLRDDLLRLAAETAVVALAKKAVEDAWDAVAGKTRKSPDRSRPKGGDKPSDF